MPLRSLRAIAPESSGSTAVEIGTMTALGRSKYFRALPSQPFIVIAVVSSSPAASCSRYIITLESTRSRKFRNAEPTITGTAKTRMSCRMCFVLETGTSRTMYRVCARLLKK